MLVSLTERVRRFTPGSYLEEAAEEGNVVCPFFEGRIEE